MRGISAALLRTMPIHSVTEVYGAEGLHLLFTVETAAVFGGPGPADAAARGLLHRAHVLATALHAPDRRQREPYINHPLRVATRILRYYHVRDAEVIAAALLHDAVEDHPGDLARIAGSRETGTAARGTALAWLADAFSPRVAELVEAVTNPVYESGADKHEQYREHVVASLEANPWARVIKLSDFTDNGVGIVYATGPKVAKLAAKYAPMVVQLREFALRADTPLDAEAKEHIAGQLDEGARRFEVILAEAATIPAAPAAGRHGGVDADPDVGPVTERVRP
jgi:hypothetical protein